MCVVDIPCSNTGWASPRIELLGYFFGEFNTSEMVWTIALMAKTDTLAYVDSLAHRTRYRLNIVMV